jgi:hypothetical protein
VAGLELSGKQDLLGIEVNGQTLTIPFFNKPCRVTPDNIVDHKGTRPPSFRVCHSVPVPAAEPGSAV